MPFIPLAKILNISPVAYLRKYSIPTFQYLPEESDSEALEELLPVLLGELLFARFLLFFSFSARMVSVQEDISKQH